MAGSTKGGPLGAALDALGLLRGSLDALRAPGREAVSSMLAEVSDGSIDRRRVARRDVSELPPLRKVKKESSRRLSSMLAEACRGQAECTASPPLNTRSHAVVVPS